ncbi:MAG TPA: ABC transporter substrate-binding protein [Acetobacteraceae bacterium]
MSLGRRTALAALATPFILPAATRAQALRPLRFGILGDLSGPYRDLSGPGTLVCVNQAIADFTAAGGSVPTTVIQADHQHKADVGSAIARQWFDSGGADVILEVNNSAIALAVATLAAQSDRVFLATGPASADLTGPRCNANMIHWTYDTWMLANGTGTAGVKAGGTSWFFLTPNYTFGQALQRDTSAAVLRAGGTVLGAVSYPFPATTDFSSFLVQAQASGAKVVGLANAGTDITNSVKQAHEFGLTRPGGGTRLAGLLALLNDVRSAGLDAAQGMLLTEPFYWDLNDRTRRFTAKVLPQMPNGLYPSTNHAGAYSAVLHCLKAVQAMGGTEHLASGRALVAQMKAMPTDDDGLGIGRIREDGRKIHDAYLFEVKTPGQNKGEWDLYNLLSTIPAEQAFRPMAEGGCPLVHA